MHLDLNAAEADVALDTEVCIVGTGAAGITAARRMLELGRTVVLLESGGLDYEASSAALNAGENVGEDYYDLEDSRLRFFGGTTAIWGGRIAELDRIDLEKRDWVPHSGWPISWKDLESYYTPARRIFGVDRRATADDLRRGGVALPDFDPAELDIGVWTFDRRFNRFVFSACEDVVNHPRCTVVTHATVTDIGLLASGKAVERLTVRSLSGRKLTVSGQVFMLAAGGMENPRLLLASRSVAANGVGNDHDQVGRYFMEHPHTRGGRVKVSGAGAWALLKAFGRGYKVDNLELAALIRPSEEAQARHGILNTSLTLAARQPAQASESLGMAAYNRIKHSVAPTRSGRALWMTSKKVAKWAQARIDPLRPWVLHKMRLRDISLVVRAEQAPNPQSRVALVGQPDALGVPRLALDWRTTGLDVESVSGLVDLLDRELRRLKLGSVEPAEWLADPEGGWRSDPLISAHPIGGYHHMGTTRMSDDPRSGVVDAAGRVHGVENLYVLGSSVFPTAGWANPTLTIAALTLRTCDLASARIPAVRAA